MKDLDPGSEFFYLKSLEEDKGGDLLDEEEERRKFTRENMCQAKFEEYFEELKKKKIKEGDESWADATSPYSV